MRIRERRNEREIRVMDETRETKRKSENHDTSVRGHEGIVRVVVAMSPIRNAFVHVKGSFSCKRGFSLLNFERGLKKNYALPNLETLCSYYSLLETATVLILCKKNRVIPEI